MDWKNRGTQISRRKFLHISSMAAAGVALAACGAGVPSAQEPAAATSATLRAPTPEQIVVSDATATAVPQTISQYAEAPMLADLVAAGELPPVDQRLPKNPKILQPYHAIGEYGGTWRRAFTGASDRFGVHTTVADHLLEVYQQEGGDVTLIPNVAESYEVNDDATEFTWNLREGHKWSDGVELSSENAVWWYENVYLNDELAPNRRYDNVRQQDHLVAIEANGPWSFKTLYSVPNPTLPLGVVRGEAWGVIGGLNFMVPHHYLQNFHPDFVDADTLQAVVEEKQVNSWSELWVGGPIGMFFFNPDLPIVGPWPMETTVPNEIIRQVRNPYYFQVDPEGNQLPYLDYITHQFHEDQQTFNLRLINGEIDAQYRRVQIADYPLLKENEASGDYRVYLWRADGNSGYSVNPTPRDDEGNLLEEQMAIVSQADFRRALSVAINRDEINELVYNGLSVARQSGPIPGSPVWKEEYETAWAQYDPDLANELLDGLGLSERDADGFRQRPDGETLVLRLDVDSAPGSVEDDQHQLIAQYWQAVGIRTVINAMERSLRETVQFSDRYSVVALGIGNTAIPLAFDGWHGGPGGGWGRYVRQVDVALDPLAVEPPADDPIWTLQALIDEAYSTVDLDAAHAKLMEALDIYYDQVYNIGVVGAGAVPLVVSNRFKNVPDSNIQANALMQINNAQPAQFYIEGASSE
jgi:peptide/nickel transport system substrate-binding protein